MTILNGYFLNYKNFDVIAFVMVGWLVSVFVSCTILPTSTGLYDYTGR